LARDPTLRADWLAVPHHGSRSSSGVPLLETLGAASAVAQAGYRNRFGHPDAEVIARYRANHVRFFRTDYSGALQWRFGGGADSPVAASREMDARYWHNRPGGTAPRTSGPPDSPEADTIAPDVIPGPPEPYVHS
jgi:competence protein ComEC